MEEVFARFPSMNVGSVREFYRNAQRVDEVTRTIGHAAKHDAENLETYLVENMEDAALASVYQETRDKIADLRSAMDWVRLASAEDIPPAEKKIYMDEFMRTIIELARGTNLAAREFREGFNNE